MEMFLLPICVYNFLVYVIFIIIIGLVCNFIIAPSYEKNEAWALLYYISTLGFMLLFTLEQLLKI